MSKFVEFKLFKYIIIEDLPMILQCKVHCWAIPEDEAEMMNVEDPGSWLKSAIDLNQVKALKQTTDEIEDPLYYCTTVYFQGTGDPFTINVPFDKVLRLWREVTGRTIVEHKDEDVDF